MAATDPRAASAKRRAAATQRRSIERIQAILDAAEALHAEQGYDAATLKAIGVRAGIPTASVYHYFADRHEVDIELMLRHRRNLDEAIANALAGLGRPTLHRALDAVVDAVFAYYREHPSIVELWFVGRHNATLGKLTHDWDEEQSHAVWAWLVERKLLPAKTPALVLHLAFEAGDRLFELAFRRKRDGDDEIIDEARRLIAAYVESYAR